MSTRTARTPLGIAEEASRYLEVVAAFAALDADPHAAARARAARAREESGAQGDMARKGVFRWRS